MTKARPLPFKGFTSGGSFTRLPDEFLRDLLPHIDDLDELKVTLAFLWQAEHADEALLLSARQLEKTCADPVGGLARAVQRGTLLRLQAGTAEPEYCLNSPRGRAAAQAYAAGKHTPGSDAEQVRPPLPNIFKLYEQNLGPLTPLIADALRDAEQEYGAEWVAEALELAVHHNKRSWKYAAAILSRWKEEGHAKKQDRRDTQELRGEAVSRKVDQFFKR